MTRTESLRIPRAHPMFDGHFPGLPLVPGSVLLDLILAARGAGVSSVSSAKFLAPVVPGDVLTLQFSAAETGSAVRFSCRCGERVVCTGVLIAAPRGA